MAASKPPGIQRLLQRLGLHDVGVHGGAMRDRPMPCAQAVRVDVHAQFDAGARRRAGRGSAIISRNFQPVSTCSSGIGGRAGWKALQQQVQQHRAVLADRIQHHRLRNSAATSRRMWMLSASSRSRWVSRIKVRLHQDRALRIDQALHMRNGGLALGAHVTLGIARTGTDGGLDDELGMVGKRIRIVARLDEGALDDGDPFRAQIGQVMLVGVPAHDRDRVEQGRDRGSAVAPGEEFRKALGVVPRRTQQHRVEARPRDRRVVPGHDIGVDACGKAGGEQRRHVLVETGGCDGIGEGEGGHGSFRGRARFQDSGIV
jgi:hypothetical protein